MIFELQTLAEANVTCSCFLVLLPAVSDQLLLVVIRFG